MVCCVATARRRVWLAKCAWKGVSAITFAPILKPGISFFYLPYCEDPKMLSSGGASMAVRGQVAWSTALSGGDVYYLQSLDSRLQFRRATTCYFEAGSNCLRASNDPLHVKDVSHMQGSTSHGPTARSHACNGSWFIGGGDDWP